MNWIRCNNCFTRADTAEEPFSLTKCGHVYCIRCIGQAGKQCVICNAIGVTTVHLQKPLEPHIAIYFTSMRDTLQHIVDVAYFQEEQVRILTKRFREVEAKCKYLKQICINMQESTTKFRQKWQNDKEKYAKKINKLENENIQLKFALHREHNSSRSDIYSNRGSTSSMLNRYSYDERYKQDNSKMNMSMPINDSLKNMSFSSNLNRQYITTPTQSDGLFQVPTIRKVLRSASTRSSSCGGVSTPMSRITRT